MDTYVKTSHTKRFVVEDSITKVTSDGEPHEMMTMIAGLSGMLAAIIILAILIALVTCKKDNITPNRNQSPTAAQLQNVESGSSISGSSDDGKHTDLIANYTRSSSVIGLTDADVHVPTRVRFSSISIVHSGNFEGNLNSAFVDSELSLRDDEMKKKGILAAAAAAAAERIEDSNIPKETKIDVEKCPEDI